MLRRTHPLVPAVVGLVGGFLALIASRQRMHELAPSFIERQGIERLARGSDDRWPDAGVDQVGRRLGCVVSTIAEVVVYQDRDRLPASDQPADV